MSDARLGSRSTRRRPTAGRCPEAIDGCVDAGLSSIGVWREPLAEVGLDDAVALVGRRRAARLLPVPRRLLHRRRDHGRDGPRTTTTGGRSTRPPPSGAPTAWCWSPADSPRATATCGRPAAGPARRSRQLVPYAHRGRRPPRPSSRCTRSTPPTAAWSPPSARRSTSPSRFPRGDVGVVVDTFHVWWDPGVEEQIARAGDRIAQLPGLRLDHPAAGRRPAVPRHDGRRPHRLRAPRAGASRPAGYTGDIEVEIFNADVWAADGNSVLDTMSQRYAELVQPHLTVPAATPRPDSSSTRIVRHVPAGEGN